jgi:hypothetical protein
MKKILAIAVATAISAPAMADLTIGGSARYQVTDTDGATATAGRVTVSVAGRSEGANGAFASYGLGLVYDMGADGETETAGDTTGETAVEDVTLTLGNADYSVQLGEFEMFKAFSSGADTFEATNNTSGTAASAGTASVGVAATTPGYENSAIRGRDQGNIQLNINAVEGWTLNVGTRIQDADTNTQFGASTTLGDVTVAAMYEAANAGKNGMTVTAGTTVSGVALNVSYGEKGAAKSTNVNASYMGFGIAMQRNADSATEEEDRVFGSYTVEDIMGIAGADVIIGAGSSENTNGSTVVQKDVAGVRLSYAF